ncbi:MAG: hypothetical protein M1817_001460 [Caeruleum heppii]|nr:MAG: hypothetical protein M1817_001460 [Caeruleum heppii]
MEDGDERELEDGMVRAADDDNDGDVVEAPLLAADDGGPCGGADPVADVLDVDNNALDEETDVVVLLVSPEAVLEVLVELLVVVVEQGTVIVVIGTPPVPGNAEEDDVALDEVELGDDILDDDGLEEIELEEVWLGLELVVLMELDGAW